MGWKEWPSWKKWSIISFAICFILNILAWFLFFISHYPSQSFSFAGEDLTPLPIYIVNLIFMIPFLPIDYLISLFTGSLSQWGFLSLFIVTIEGLLGSFIIGAIIGWIVGKIRNK